MKPHSTMTLILSLCTLLTAANLLPANLTDAKVKADTEQQTKKTVPFWNEYLHKAVKAEDESEVIRLLDLGAEVNWQDSTGRSALHHAAAGTANSMEIVSCLLEHKADPNLKDKNGQIPGDLAENGGILHLFMDNCEYMMPGGTAKDSQCLLCRGIYGARGKFIKTPACGHEYHESCYKAMEASQDPSNKYCPSCFQKILLAKFIAEQDSTRETKADVKQSGTKDENVSQKLYSASMLSMMQNHKEATAVQTPASAAAANASASSATSSTSATFCSSSTLATQSNSSLPTTRALEQKDESNLKIEKSNTSMVKIKSWKDVEPFAGRVIAYRAKTYYFRNEARSGNPINQDISLRYGYISNETSQWSGGEEGFNITMLLKPKEGPGNHALVNSKLDDDDLEMRLATPDEIEQMRKAIHAGTAKFEYVYDEKQADAMLSGTINTYWSNRRESMWRGVNTANAGTNQ